MLDRLSFAHGFFKAVQFTNTKNELKNLEAFCSVRKLSSFYLQLRFDHYELNYQPQVLSEILQRKTLYQVSFDSDVLKIY